MTAHQHSLFDSDEVVRRTAQGIADSYDSADQDWRAFAFDQVEYLARTIDNFTTDEVIERLGQAAVDAPNLMALGHVMRQSARNGVIYNTGTRRRTRIPRRHRELTVWGSVQRSTK